MIKVIHRVHFHCSPATLFAALTDFPNAPKWQPAVLEERALTDGPLQVGVKTYQKRLFRGKAIESICEIVEFEQDHKMVCRREGEVQTSYFLEPDGDGTWLTFSIELKGKGLMWFLMQPMIKAGLTKDVVTRFQTLKGQLEARTAIGV